MTVSANRRLGVLASGRGSNLQAIIDAIERRSLDAQIAVVLSDKPDAGALRLARAAGIPAIACVPRDHAGRVAYDAALAAALAEREVALVCLAGFMRLVGPPLLAAYEGRMLNIHPSLLPAFPGLHAQRQALDYGVRVSGATVHFVTSALDGGPIVLQAAVPVMDDDTPDRLAARILVEEHRIYPRAIQLVLDGGWAISGRRVVWRTAASPGR